jgi:choline-sulfatase
VNTRKKDMLIFISDQHAGFCSGYAGDPVVRTPHLDCIAQEGTAFDAACTSHPLCIPARMSMLSGQLPSKTGIMENVGSLPSDRAAFLHALGIVANRWDRRSVPPTISSTWRFIP